MNNDLAFLLSRYIVKKTGNLVIDQAYSSFEVLKLLKEDIKGFLNKKLALRPTKTELESKNIIKKEFVDFKMVHTVLEKIPFRRHQNKICPRIANIATKIEFGLKRKILIEKLGLNKNKD